MPLQTATLKRHTGDDTRFSVECLVATSQSVVRLNEFMSVKHLMIPRWNNTREIQSAIIVKLSLHMISRTLPANRCAAWGQPKACVMGSAHAGQRGCGGHVSGHNLLHIPKKTQHASPLLIHAATLPSKLYCNDSHSWASILMVCWLLDWALPLLLCRDNNG